MRYIVQICAVAKRNYILVLYSNVGGGITRNVLKSTHIPLYRIYTIIQVKYDFVKSFFYFFSISKFTLCNPLKVLSNIAQCKFLGYSI